jgi:hypothetical protein
VAASCVDDVPVAHTPPGGYGEVMPAPILGGCGHDLVDGAPDLRGTWRVVSVTTADGDTLSSPGTHPAIGSVQRIEQCGDRIVITGSGVVHDMRCDGTFEGGVHDVMQSDFTTAIDVIATYEEGVHVLRPQGLPFEIEVRRRRDGDHLIWDYLGFTARLEQVEA